MSVRLSRIALSACLVLSLAGCVASNGGGSPAQSSSRDAARANMQLGVAYLQQGNLVLAKEKLERAEKQDPRNAELQTSLAYLYERLGRDKDAEARYRQAQRLAPQSAAINNNFAVFLCRAGRTEEALQRFQAAARDPLYPTPWAALAIAAVCLRSVKRADEAQRYLEQAIYLRPNYAEAVFELADLRLASADANGANAVVDRFLALGTATPEVLLVGVRAAIARGDRQGADLYARRLRRDFPDTAQARMLPQLLGNGG